MTPAAETGLCRRIDVVTIFPGMVRTVATYGVVGRAVERGVLAIEAHDVRRWAGNRHGKIDDAPYGGGPGMVMAAPPLVEAVEALRGPGAHVLLTGPRGRTLTQDWVVELATHPQLILLCGRYQDVDERVRELVVDEEVSLGDYIVSGGELAAMVVADAVARQVTGVVGDPGSLRDDAFGAAVEGGLSWPQYTRPASYRGLTVPAVLVSGHHERIEAWRRAEARRLTRARRPDLLAGDETT